MHKVIAKLFVKNGEKVNVLILKHANRNEVVCTNLEEHADNDWINFFKSTLSLLIRLTDTKKCFKNKSLFRRSVDRITHFLFYEK